MEGVIEKRVHVRRGERLQVWVKEEAESGQLEQNSNRVLTVVEI